MGVIGRTGSGKTTLALGILRIIETSQNNDSTIGSITIDNLDISQVGINHLRSRLAVIP